MKGRGGAGLVVAMVAGLLAVGLASAHPPPDPLHGGSGEGVTVIGHSDLGGAGLNGEVAVLGDYAYVGAGTNGGFAAQWSRTPKCDEPLPYTVKVVSLTNPANPTVVSTIPLPSKTVGRAVAALRVRPLSAANAYTGDLLAVALESCNADAAGLVGVQLYDVSNPATPIPLGNDNRFLGNTATRDVSLVQRPDGRVLALEANQGGNFGRASGGGGGIHVVDVTNPAVPSTIGVFYEPNATASTQGCRAFNYAQGVAVNATGTRVYAAYEDQGLFLLDANPNPSAQLPRIGQALYDPPEEGNSFRFVPNADETAALATDEDPLPARTTVSISGAGGPQTFSACEAIWGAPLYRRALPSLADRGIVDAGTGCSAANYTGLVATGKIALVNRGCDFVAIAKAAQGAGAAAVLVAGGRVFSPDSADPGDAGVSIPVVLTSAETGTAIRSAIAAGPVTAALADTPDTWGALRIFRLSGADLTHTAVFNAPHTRTLTPGDGLYNAVNAEWAGEQALVAWMSDGLRVVDVQDRSAPKAGPFYVPPTVVDPTGNFPTAPLVVGVARFGSRVVITDINSGLYVLDLTGGDGGGPGTGGGPGGAGTSGPAGSATGTAPGTGGAQVSGGAGAAALGSDAVRARGLRSCLAGVKRRARRDGKRARTPAARARVKRAKQRGRRACLKRYGRTPGPVTGLRVRAVSKTRIVLTFRAAGTNGTKPPAARAYLIKQSLSPIRSARDYSGAQPLCKGSCRFKVKRVGAALELMVTDLRPKTTYYYAIQARDNVSGRLGSRSTAVKARTR